MVNEAVAQTITPLASRNVFRCVPIAVFFMGPNPLYMFIRKDRNSCCLSVRIITTEPTITKTSTSQNQKSNYLNKYLLNKTNIIKFCVNYE